MFESDPPTPAQRAFAHDPVTIGVAIVGAGFSGLGMAIRLRQTGQQDFVILERADEVGGVWRDNTYPGCACDVESHLYSFSFALNPYWSSLFSGQAEIQAYLRDCAFRYGILAHIRFGHAFEAARWDEDAGLWRIETSAGPVSARVLISGTGAFSEPSLPPLPGLADFGGRVFHSARWDHAYDLRGRRVAVIGTGASAIQFVPEIQPLVSRLSLYQRTPAWIVPRPDRPVSAREQALFARFPQLQRMQRRGIYLRRELFGLSFRHPGLMGLSRQLALRHLARQVPDPALRAALTPDYVMGCKRVLLSNRFYPAVASANVELVTGPIETVTRTGLRSRDGCEREADAIIFGTGFQVTEYRLASRIYGRSGESLSESWRGSPQAHLGTMNADFPNLFMLLGPNTGLGHSSVVLMIEAQLELVLSCLELMRRRDLHSVEPRRESQADFVAELDARSRSTVWTSGCRSWYLDASGRNATLWPASIDAFRQRLLPLRPNEFELRARSSARENA